MCAADLAARNGDTASANAFLEIADKWQKSVQGWTATTTGRYSSDPYYLRLTEDAQPDQGTTYSIGDSGPSAIDQRRVVDPSFLELVRLGVKPPQDPVIVSTIPVVDAQLGVTTPTGTFWHRYEFDGYGEKRDGSPWDVSQPDTFQTIGRIWPIFAGERGEYELAAGSSASARLTARALPPPAGRGDVVGHAAGVVARAVRAPGVVDRRRPAGRAPGGGRLPLHGNRLLTVQPTGM